MARRRIRIRTHQAKPRCIPLIAILLTVSACSATQSNSFPINTLTHTDIPRLVAVSVPRADPVVPQSNSGCMPAPESAEVAQWLTELPVGFEPGEYRRAYAADIETLINALPKNITLMTRIDVVGHSRSRSNLATDRLALKRAKIVAQHLKDAGVSPSIIRLTSDVRNNLGHVGTYPGAVATFHMEQPGAIAPKADPTIEIADTVVAPVFYTVEFRAGSLRENLVRVIEDHGYTLGDWNFGNETTTTDWIIDKSYSYPVQGDLIAVLNTVKKTYGLMAILNELDKTVDFEAAIARGTDYAL